MGRAGPYPIMREAMKDGFYFFQKPEARDSAFSICACSITLGSQALLESFNAVEVSLLYTPTPLPVCTAPISASQHLLFYMVRF